MPTFFRYSTSAITLLLALSSQALAQTALPTIDVTATAESAGGSLTVPDNQTARETIQRTPGGVAVVDSATLEDKYIVNFKDTLAYVPGVYAQPRYGEEVRLAIRGSGLSRGFHLRGITLLQDGIPFNLADGSGDFQEADPLTFQRLEVYRGGNALQYGSTTLGGAVNMVTKTGRSHPGNQVQVEYGSFDTYRLNLQTGQALGDTDYFVSLTGADSAGFRSHEDRSNIKFNSNVGVAVTEDVETRFYLSGNIIEQDLAGTISRNAALNDPTSTGFNAIAQDIARDIRSVRVANKTTVDLGAGNLLDVGAFLNMKDLFHPLSFGVIDQDSTDYGAFAQASGAYELAGYTNRYRAGVTSHIGHTDAKTWANVSGSRASVNPTGDADLNSQNYALYGENEFFVLPEWALVTGAQLTWSEREESNLLLPAESDARIYRAFNPKLGVLYEPSESLQFFANVSRSEEVPTFSELTAGNLSAFVPLDAQEAITYEVGSRGQHGAYRWDISLYRSEIEGELLNFSSLAGLPSTTFNADKTIHQGLELGLDMRLGQNLLTAGDHLQWRNAYTFSEFTFDNDPIYGNNEIAGQPAHFYRAELRYDQSETGFLQAWHIAPNVEWVPIGAEVDFTNTIDTPGYVVFGLSAGAAVNDNVEFFVDGRNLLDQDYITTFSTIADPSAPMTSLNVYYPGEERSVFGGVRVKF